MTYYKVKYTNKTTKVKTTEVCTGKRYDEIGADKNLRVREATNYRRDYIPEQIGIIKED